MDINNGHVLVSAGDQTTHDVSVADPDRQIRGRPGHPYLEIRGEPGLKFCFSALRASVWSKNKGEPGPPLDLLLDLRVHHSVEGVRKSGGRFSSPI